MYLLKFILAYLYNFSVLIGRQGFLVILFCSLCYAGQSQSSDRRLQGLEEEIALLMTKYQAVGLSVSVVEKNQVVYVQGFGHRDISNKLPVDIHTTFGIASCTKAFTAALLGILASEDKISLLDPPSDYIPQFQFYNNQMNNLIAIEDLLSHKSGLGQLDASLILFPEKDRRKIAARLKYLKPEGAIKNSWIYSNMGYTLAGTIVEQVAQQSWESYLRQTLLEPLEMDQTYTALERASYGKNASVGYGLIKGEIQSVTLEKYDGYSPAGGIISSAVDMAHWMMAWLNKGRYKGRQIIPQSFIQQATHIQNIRPNQPEENVFLFGEGWGWRMESSYGNYKVYHGGNSPGFSSLVLTFPYKQLGITVLTNQENSILPYVIADLIKNRMFNQPRVDIQDYPVSVEEVYQGGKIKKGWNQSKLPSHTIASFTGQYAHPGYGTLEIKAVEDQLLLHFPTYTFILEHLHYNTFVMKSSQETLSFNPEFKVQFRTDYLGQISELDIPLQSEPVKFVKE